MKWILSATPSWTSCIGITKKTFGEITNWDDRPIIALLPGSRKQEIDRMLQTMLAMPPFFPNHQFVIACAPSISESHYLSILDQKSVSNVSMVSNQTYPLLSSAEAALVTSGTATLETALFKVPQVVCYKGNSVSFQLAKRLINVRYISLVNLVLDRPLVKELIQKEFNTRNLRSELELLLMKGHRKTIHKGYEQLYLKLGESGASDRAAHRMYDYLIARN